MAKIKFGQIISEARGKIAGMVFSKNGSGSFIRQKVTPINPSSLRQQQARSYLIAASKAWAVLSETIHKQWNTVTTTFKKQNSIGDTYTVSGFNLFVSRFSNALNVLSAAPTTYPGNDDAHIFTSLTGSIARPADIMTIVFAPAIPASDTVEIMATPPISLGKTFVRSEYRRIGFATVASISPLDITAAYVSKYGRVPSITEQCYVYLASTNTTSFKKVPTFKAGNDLAGKIK